MVLWNIAWILRAERPGVFFARATLLLRTGIVGQVVGKMMTFFFCLGNWLRKSERRKTFPFSLGPTGEVNPLSDRMETRRDLARSQWQCAPPHNDVTTFLGWRPVLDDSTAVRWGPCTRASTARQFVLSVWIVEISTCARLSWLQWKLLLCFSRWNHWEPYEVIRWWMWRRKNRSRDPYRQTSPRSPEALEVSAIGCMWIESPAQVVIS